MRATQFRRLGDRELLQKLYATAAKERGTTATLLALIAETDARRLYLPAGYPSMYQFCIQELHLSDDSAYKRIQAARAARQFPALFRAVAKGRLHLSAVVLLAPHLTRENVRELVGAATHKTKAAIERLLAERFPRTELLPMVHALPAVALMTNGQVAPGQVGAFTSSRINDLANQHALEPVAAPAPRPKVQPVATTRFALQFMIDQSTHDDLEYARALLSHRIPSGDLAQIFSRALKALITEAEKTKFAATSKPRTAARRSSTNLRHIPARVKRAVWERDQGMCTFTSETGQRCVARKFLEFDHIDPVARNGQATAENLRLRCRGHNEFEADRTFGAGFMRAKRESTRREALEARKAREARQPLSKATPVDQEVIDCLRSLRFRVDEARSAAALCEDIPDAPLEERVRRALTYFKSRFRTYAPAAQGLAQAP